MFVAVKKDDGFLVGYSILDNCINMDESDTLLEDNIPVWKLRGKKGVLVICKERDFASTLLKYNKKLFNFDICDKEMYGGFVSRLKNFLRDYDLIDDKSNWSNELLIVNGDEAYIIDTDFTVTKITDYYSCGSWFRLTTGSLTESIGRNAETRIVDAFRLVEKMRNCALFPISIYDSRNGKRKIVRISDLTCK